LFLQDRHGIPLGLVSANIGFVLFIHTGLERQS
jgi:hypothetical protein